MGQLALKIPWDTEHGYEPQAIGTTLANEYRSQTYVTRFTTYRLPLAFFFFFEDVALAEPFELLPLEGRISPAGEPPSDDLG